MDAFFHAWELHGTWDRVRREFRTKDPSKAEAAAALHQDALRLLEQAVKENRYQARGVIGIFPANSTASHDDITVWADESRTIPLATLLTQRQQLDKGETRLALADFIAPEGVRDYVGAMAVSIHGSAAGQRNGKPETTLPRPAGQLSGGPPGGGFRGHRP
ncbi:MAG: vitamin B12 dependent-methionine synthase activation domain-containing protein [Akkermansia muciniphila]